MNRNTIKYRLKRTRLFIGIGVVLAASSYPVLAQTSSDSIILSAMHDELFRNYKELSASEMESPFFIGYTIANAKNLQVSATLGALNYSRERKYKDWHVRLMAGDYKINDENFSSNQPDEVVFRQSIQMPVEDDYEGIRRSLWLTTNNLFYSASRSYKNKMALIENKQINESDLEIEDFSREAVSKTKISSSVLDYDRKELETLARRLSGIFNSYPEVFASSVKISVFESTVYFINSEGSEIQFPFNIATLSIQAQSMTDDSDRLNKKINYLAARPSELPDEQSIEKDVYKILENLITLKSTARFEDDYFGPVLVIGEVAAETMEKFLFSGSNALIAKRETLQSGSQQSVFYSRNENGLQTKIGKPILSNDITITAEPFLKEYNGKKLMGTFTVDAEAVVPPEKLVLVENGILKTLLNGRTPSREVPNSNGHMRFDYSIQGLNKTVGPGVIRIKAANTVSISKMKEELLAEAKELGLDYALMIKSMDVGGSDKPFNFYKINVETGEEELTRAVRLRNLSLYSLRRSPLFAETELVHNTLVPVYQQNSDDLSGIPGSFILPEAILLKEIEMESYRKPLTSLLPLIENPVGKGKVISTDGDKE